MGAKQVFRPMLGIIRRAGSVGFAEHLEDVFVGVVFTGVVTIGFL